MNNYCDIDKRIAYICNCQYKYFLNKANVIGVGLGYKIRHGFHNCEKCITVFVRKKFSLNELSSQDIIPKDYMNIPKIGKSTRLNSSHANISYAVFCLKKKKTIFILLYLK